MLVCMGLLIISRIIFAILRIYASFDDSNNVLIRAAFGGLAFSNIIEAVFSICGTLLFLQFLRLGNTSNFSSFMWDIISHYDGHRIFITIVLYATQAIFFGMESVQSAAINDRSLFYFLPSFTYTLELRAFIELLFLNSPKILMNQSKKG